ncbi:MAG: hypothetical protein OXN97_24245 [Bryobacterales bacterium]|nr:hypothetical protein [Bryobacterales bacterium]
MTPPGWDAGLDTLPNLHGQTPFIDGTGHRVRLAAPRTEAAAERPHGLGRSLELYAPDRTTRVGFGNAHPAREARGPGTRRRRESGHGQRMRTMRFHECGDATTLPGDFRKEADAVPRAGGAIP